MNRRNYLKFETEVIKPRSREAEEGEPEDVEEEQEPEGEDLLDSEASKHWHTVMDIGIIICQLQPIF